MKILLLNPKINAEHAVARALHTRGVGILFPASVDEAWQMLQHHGTSIDLAVVHREGASAGIAENEPGIRFIARVKADPSQADLPIILTSGIWGEREFSRHQQSAMGVNAYLSAPYKEHQLIQMMEAVLGQPVGAELTGAIAAPPAGPVAGPVLEDISDLYSRQTSPSNSGISLEAPSIPTAQRTALSKASAPMELSISIEAPALTSSVPTAAAATDFSISEPQEAIAISSDATASMQIEHTRLADSSEKAEPAHEVSEVATAARPTYTPGMLDIGTLSGTSSGSDSDPDITLDTIEEEAVKQDLPYLYGNVEPEVELRTNPAMLLGRPLGDAVVPGGAAQAPDTETLKKYLLLREQDVSVLSSQLRTAQEQVKNLESQLREERGRTTHLTHVNNEQAQKIDGYERNQSVAVESLQSEINDLRFELKTRTDKARALESQVRASTDEIERLKERVRLDIRKIRVREKDLENKLEISRKDSEALIAARENKIMELKRKLDLVEFNLDLLQGQYTKEKEVSATLRERLLKAAQVVRVAGGLLDQPQSDQAGKAAKSAASSKDLTVELELEEATNQEAS